MNHSAYGKPNFKKFNYYVKSPSFKLKMINKEEYCNNFMPRKWELIEWIGYLSHWLKKYLFSLKKWFFLIINFLQIYQYLQL